ncbi:MAG TPA: hypothetical protein VKE74_32590 [Gemmataceae bacterium]|nr:hypothetical protein [Gemmataceae bacterium]
MPRFRPQLHVLEGRAVPAGVPVVNPAVDAAEPAHAAEGDPSGGVWVGGTPSR